MHSIHITLAVLTSESLDQLRDFIGCLGRGILENF
jgi:hypothetical protein